MKILFYLASAYLILLFFAYFFSEKLIFVPPSSSYHDQPEVIKLKAKSGTTIAAIYLANPDAKYIVLVNHGNAEDIGYMYPFLQSWQRNGFNVFAYDYPGYGLSSGKPTEQGAYEAAETAYDYLTKILNIAPNKIITYGRSVGAAIAIDLATHQKVAAIIAESPFVSAFRVMTHFKILPFDRFDNLKKIKKITAPILFIHGRADTIVPFWHSLTLYEHTPGIKSYYWVANANHNNLFYVAGEKNYFEQINNFLMNFNRGEATH